MFKAVVNGRPMSWALMPPYLNLHLAAFLRDRRLLR
jgi:hypothetical protein